MSILFSAGDVFEIAIQIERNGAAFYRKAAQAAEPAVRQELLDLAAMEDGHEATFTELKRQLAPDNETVDWPEAEDEVVQYLQTFARGQVFDMTQDPSALLTAETTLHEALGIAIERERDSVVFFVGMKEWVPAAMGRDKIEFIIRQEMQHITQISQRLREIPRRT